MDWALSWGRIWAALGVAALVWAMTAAVILMRPILPYALAFAAGAMILVVVEELIPEAQLEKKTDIATVGVMLGFR